MADQTEVRRDKYGRVLHPWETTPRSGLATSPAPRAEAPAVAPPPPPPPEEDEPVVADEPAPSGRRRR